MNKKPGTDFRLWLVRKVSTSVFAFYKDDTDEELARRMGVQEDVLRDARVLFEERKEREQLPEGQRMGYRMRILPAAHNKNMLWLEPPEEIYEEWVALRDQRRIREDAVLLRSVVHAILKTKTQPRWISELRRKAWISKRGEWIGQENVREHRFRIAGRLSTGAFEALRTRAKNTGCTPSSIARWAVNLFVHQKLGESLLILTTVQSMYRTPEEYCTSPTITET